MPAAEEQDGGLVVGVISDTHGHLYPEVKELLAGVDHIIHAGDVCTPSLLSELRAIAPLTVVRGNCDAGPWADAIPVRAELELGGARILIGHIGGRLREEAASRGSGRGGVDVVISGHSHQALVEQKDGVLYVNPGSAGPRRYGRPRTMAFLRIAPDSAEASANIVVVEG
jgi:putative phosphoesterase